MSAVAFVVAGARLAQSDAPGAGEVRRVTREVFERPEFDESPNVIQRVLDWIARHLPRGSVGGDFTGAAGQLLTYVLFVVVALVVVAVVLLVIRGWVRRRRPAEPDVEIEEEEPERTVGEWQREAERYEAEGVWREALRCRYRELVGRLVEREAVSPVPGRTTGELRVDVADSIPTAAAAFDEVSTAFELAWYAGLPTGEAENRRVRDLSVVVLAAPIVRRTGDIGGSPDLMPSEGIAA